MTPEAALDIVQRRLLSQKLLGAGSTTPAEVVRWLGAVQAQDYAGAKWALGIRMRAATDARIERAFTAGTILRTHVLRPTWHFVTPADIRWLLALTAPRVHAANAYMYRRLGLATATFRRSRGALTRALQGGRFLTRDELRVVLRRSGIGTEGEMRMAYLLMHAELEGLVCSGPRRGKQFTYALLDERVPPAPALKQEEALAELARRFFTSRGPATVQDFAKWSGLTVATARGALDSVRRSLERDMVEGRAYWCARTRRRAARVSTPTAHLLSVYDEYVSGYRDRSAMVDRAVAARLAAMGNALTSIVVVDGRVVGTWTRWSEGGAAAVETEIFRRLSRGEGRAVEGAIRAYTGFLGAAARRVHRYHSGDDQARHPHR